MNYGAGANAQNNETASFRSGRLGMFMQSSASIGQLTTGNQDQLGITYYPHPDGQKSNGVAIGGASLWISNDKPSNVQRGAWEFIKYLMTAKSQAQWQVATGYLALNKDSQKEAVCRTCTRSCQRRRFLANNYGPPRLTPPIPGFSYKG